MEARPYALLVGFLAIAAVFWQRIGEKRFMTPLFAFFLTLAVACHPLAVVSIYPFGLAELVRTFISRQIRRSLARLPVCDTPFILSLPVLVHYRDLYSDNFWSRPSWATVGRTYGFYLSTDNLLIAILIVFFTVIQSYE